MLQHCTYRETIRDPAPMASSETLDFSPGDTRGGALFVTVSTLGWTVGQLDVQVQGSYNQVVYFNLGALGQSNFARTITAADYSYLLLSGALPPHLRVELTPSGGLDAQVGVVARSQVRIETDFAA